jgi:hypothetical protein
LHCFIFSDGCHHISGIHLDDFQVELGNLIEPTGIAFAAAKQLGKREYGSGGEDVGDQHDEIDGNTAATPSTGERHHPDRVETLADEVATGVDGIGADAKQFGDLSAYVTRAAGNGSPDPNSHCTQPSY